jgi:hypothetical protein
MEAFGVRSGRSQEAGEKRAAYRADQKDYTEQRRKLYDAYSRTDNPSERAAIQREGLRNFNDRWPESPLTIGDLVKAKRRFDTQQTADPSQLGITMSRRQKAFLPRYDAYTTFE